MKYKILISILILFIISISVVSAETPDNQTIETNDESNNINNNILFENTIKEPTDEGNEHAQLSPSKNTNEYTLNTENNEPLSSYANGTFKDLENILWKASEGDKIVLDRDYFYDGADRKTMSINTELTIDGNGHTLDGKGGARIFYISSTVKKITLMNINFINGHTDGAGGAILNDGAQLNIINCSFINNRITGGTGGAIASNKDNTIIKDSTFSGNYALGIGGAVSIVGDNAVITNCIFTNNEVKESLGGGAVIIGYYATVKNNTFTYNKAGRDGGAIDIEAMSETKTHGDVISDNIFIGNSAVFGGAIGFNGEDSIISNNIFKSNKAIFSESEGLPGIGGAIRVVGDNNKNVTIVNNTFTDNSAYRKGGAFFLKGPGSVISNNTFTNNTAIIESGGSMDVNGDDIIISENKITDSTSKSAGGAIFANGNNLKIINNEISQSKSTDSYGGAIQVRGDYATISGNKLTNNTAPSDGGSLYIASNNANINNNTFTGNSAVIGGAVWFNGQDSTITNNIFKSNKAIDSTSHGFAGIGGAIRAIGEKNITITNNTFTDNTAYRQGGAFHLQAADSTISKNTFTNNTATIDAGGTMIVNGDDITISENKITDSTSKSAGGAIFANGNNLKIINNEISQSKTTDSYGGAIQLKGNSTTITNNKFTENTAKSDGGALYIASNKAIINDNTFTENRAVTGGAVWFNGQDSTITNNIFKSNKATDSTSHGFAGVGGAIRAIGEKNITITNNTFTDNTAYRQGGAFHLQAADSTISKNTFTNNTVTIDAGGSMNLRGDGITISENKITSSSSKTVGGAIYANGKNTLLTNNILEKCSAGDNGGGFYLVGSGSVTDSSFTSCSAEHDGGGIYFTSRNYTLNGNTFKSNSAKRGPDYYPTDMPTGRTSTKLTANDVSTTYGSVKYLIATLKDSDDKIISGAQVKIELNDFTKTLTTDNNGQVSLSTDGLIPNTYTARITFAGDNKYDASSTTAKVTVNKIETKLTAKYDADSKNIVATVKDTNGKPISDLKVGFAIDGVKYITTDANGQAKYSTADLAEKTYTVPVQAYGNEIYKDSNKETVTFSLIKISTTLTANDVTTTYNSSGKLVATLKDNNGKAIKDAEIKIVMGNITKTLTTDANGQVSLTTDGLAPDIYTATITFEGNDIYKASSTTAKVTVNKLETKLTAKYDASSKNIIATVKDANGKPLSNVKVSFAINGEKYVTTDANGQAKYSTAGLADGTYNVTVQAYGNEIYKDSDKQTVTFTIGSKQQAKIYLRNALYFVLQTKIVTVTLWDANNNPIAGKTVYINLDEYGLKYSGVTDENGNAYIRVGVGFGNHPATVSFEGDDQYSGDAKTGRVRVIKETPSLMLPGAYTKFKASEPTKTIKVYLKDRYNKPLLPGTKVFVTINGKQYVGSINSEGIASINIILHKAGVYNVDLYYTGNTAYNAVRKTTKITLV